MKSCYLVIILLLSTTVASSQYSRLRKSGVQDTLSYFASFETQSSVVEERVFSNIGSTRTAINPLFYPGSSILNENYNNKFWSRLLPNSIMGPSLLIKVDSADNFEIYVEGLVPDNSPKGNAKTEIVTREIKRASLSFLEPLFFGAGFGKLKNIQVPNKFNNTASLLESFSNSKNVSINQGAYINWIFLDTNFAATKSSEMGFVKVNERNKMEILSATNLSSSKAGYLLVYLSNESNTSVFFDNLLVKQIKSPPTISLLSASFIITENGFNITTEGSINLITEN